MSLSPAGDWRNGHPPSHRRDPRNCLNHIADLTAVFPVSVQKTTWRLEENCMLEPSEGRFLVSTKNQNVLHMLQLLGRCINLFHACSRVKNKEKFLKVSRSGQQFDTKWWKRKVASSWGQCFRWTLDSGNGRAPEVTEVVGVVFIYFKIFSCSMS